MKALMALTMLLISFGCFSQVGINTRIPSDAAALDINANSVMGFGGLKLPTVTNLQKGSIAVTPASEATMLFVTYPNGSRCLEIYDGIGDNWQKINCLTLAPTILYTEDFESYATGTGINGAGNSGDYPGTVSKWTLTDINNTLSSSDYVETRSGLLEINDTNGPIEFETQSINISGYSNISFTLDLSGTGTLEYDPTLHSTDTTNMTNDYMNVSFSIDNGPFTTILDFNGNGTMHHTLVPYYTSGSGNTAPFFPDDTVTQSGISGSTLVIRVSFQNWAGDEYLYIDNIEVSGN